MRHWIHNLLSNLVRRATVSTPRSRPTLEQLEDRCVPSANMMMPMDLGMSSMDMSMPSMNMQPMVMQTMTSPSMNMQSMPTNLMNGVNPTLLAAVDHLFVDFNQTLQQVLSSTTTQQFIANEAHMIGVLATDIAQIRMLASPTGHTG